MSSRRIIESSDDESPPTATSNPLGPYSPHLSPQNNTCTLQTSIENLDDFLKLINNDATTYQKVCILQALRGAQKKVRIGLFRKEKGRVVLGSWWDDCLTHLTTSNRGEYEEILVELFHLATAVKDMLKNVNDLNKAKAKMGVDLVSKMEATKKAFEKIGEGELEKARAGFVEAARHFKEFYGMDFGVDLGPAGGSAAAVSGGTSAKPEGGTNSSNQPARNDGGIDREEAAKLKRMEAMRKSQSRRAGTAPAVGSSPAKPNVNNSSGAGINNGDGFGRHESGNDGSDRRDAGHAGSNDYARAPAVGGDGFGRHEPTAAGVNASSSHASDSARPPAASSGPRVLEDNGSSEGWGRRTPEQKPELSGVQKMLLVPFSDARSNEQKPAGNVDSQPPGARDQAAANESNYGSNYAGANDRDSQRNHSQSNYARDHGSNDYRDSRPHYERDHRSNNSGTRNSQTDRPSNYGSDNRDRQSNDDSRDYGSIRDRGTGNDSYGSQSRYDSRDRGPNNYSTSNARDSHRDGSNYRSNKPTGMEGRFTHPSNYARDAQADQSMDRSSNYASRDRGSGYADNRDSQMDRPSSNYGARDQSAYSATNNRDSQNRPNNYGRGSNKPASDYRDMSRSSNYGSDNNPPSSAYDSQTHQPYRNEDQKPAADRYNSSDHPSGGNFRNNQSAGRNDGPQAQSNYSSRDSYDRRDSGRASTQRSKSSDRQYEDRRDYDDRGRRSDRPASSSYRSDSASRDTRGNFRRYDDDYRRDSSDRYDDRKRRDRDESFRGGSSRSLCKYFLRGSCRNGASCRFSHEDGGRTEDRGSRGRAFDDGGSEDGEVRPTKKFRGYDGDGARSTAPTSSAGAGRGRGRGRDINKPAWMTQGLKDQPSAAPSPAPLSNADLANVLSSVNASSAPPAGRGRGNIDNRPAWMTQQENGKSGPTSAGPASAAPAANEMGGRFVAPPRGRGRGVDNRPAWMAKGERN